MATIHTDDALSSWISSNDGWARAGEVIEKTFEFESFVPAVEFVNRVAELAEEMNHHPDLDIRYNKVRVGLATHDAGGITDLDTTLAQKIDGTA